MQATITAGKTVHLSTTLLIAGQSVFVLVLHLLTNTGYGIHRDELLYWAMGEHLAWGFREVPPFIAGVAWVARAVLGSSLFAVRLIPSVFAALNVVLVGLMVRELGGRRIAVLLAGTATLIAPVYLRSGMLLQPVVFDQFFWALGTYLVLRIIRTGDRRLWWALGVVAGLGLLNKHSMLFWGFGLFAGILVARRDWLRHPGPWLAAALASLIALPNVLWQANNAWPLLRHMEELSRTQLVHVDPVDFLIGQVLIQHPIALPVWISGLVFLFTSQGKAYRVLGWMYLAVLAVMLVAHGKAYYLAPAYFVLLAAGGVSLEKWIGRPGVIPAYMALLVIGGIHTLPVAIPVLPTASLERYTRAVGLNEANRDERGEYERIPQDFADMLPWENQVATVARAFRTLTPAERADAVVIAENYGQAGAIDYFGPQYGLPGAISTASSYYLWGPGEKTGAVAVLIGVDREDITPYYRDVVLAGTARHAYARWYERDVPIFIARRPYRSLQAVWPELDN